MSCALPASDPRVDRPGESPRQRCCRSSRSTSGVAKVALSESQTDLRRRLPWGHCGSAGGGSRPSNARLTRCPDTTLLARFQRDGGCAATGRPSSVRTKSSARAAAECCRRPMRRAEPVREFTSPHFSHRREKMRASSRYIWLSDRRFDCSPSPASFRFAALARCLRRAQRCSSSQRNDHSSSSRLALGAKHFAIFRDRCEKCGLVWFAINWLKKFPMHFGPRLGARRVKAGGVRGMPRAGLNAHNLLRAGTEGHGRAMATTSNDAFGQKGAEIIQ